MLISLLMQDRWNQASGTIFSQPFYPLSIIMQISAFLHYFLLGDVNLLGPQSETIGVHQLYIWLSATNTSISLN